MDDVTPTGTEATELGGSFARWALIAIWLLSLAWGSPPASSPSWSRWTSCPTSPC